MSWQNRQRVFAPPTSLPWLRSHASVPCARRVEGSRYRVYFSGRDGRQRSSTGFFELDLQRPQEVLSLSEQPVLRPGPLGSFDEDGAMATWVLDHDGRTYLYYIGWNRGLTVPFRNALGVAVSDDGGQTFRKPYPGPILDRGIHDPCFVGSACVLVEGSCWRMWYLSCVGWEMHGGVPQHRYHIKYAESADGLEWYRDGTVCIDFASPLEHAISRPSVLCKGLTDYWMWFSARGQSYRIGFAQSEDGIGWHRDDHAGGLGPSSSGWDSRMVEYPHVFEHRGRRYMLYNGNGFGETGIGLALWAPG